MAADGAKKKGGAKLDFATIGGLLLAMGGIVGGLLLEGGKIQDISQVTAAMIVLGGTIGAVMVTMPMNVLIGAVKRLALVFFDKGHSTEHLIEEIIVYATKGRKSGIVSLEDDLEAVSDPFLKKALSLAVDGMELQQLRENMELQLSQDEKRGEAEAKVFEAAGGYAPTVGIIGAVLGLIQVMKHLENIEEVGHGIAVAFVATVYGVGVANLLFLPAAAKIKARIHHNVEAKELMLEGVCGIIEGLNPKLIRSKLEAFVEPSAAGKKAGKGAKEPVGEPASV
jgi:chemotaxis protein MotA